MPGLPLIPRRPERGARAGAASRCSSASASGCCSTRPGFGFDLRATGASATAAVASGINVKRMVVVSMLLSGGVAGLIWLPLLFGDAHSYGTTFQAGLGFTGIAVALLGRNHPVGMAFGALLFAFLVEQTNLLDDHADISTTSSRSPRACWCWRGHRLRAGPPLPPGPSSGRWPSSSPRRDRRRRCPA